MCRVHGVGGQLASQVTASICSMRRLAVLVVVREVVPVLPSVPAHDTCHWMVAVTTKALSLGFASGDSWPSEDST